MNYYKTNAIYAELERRRAIQFVWTSGNAWILLYADNSATVKIVAFVSGTSTHCAEDGTKVRLQAACSTAKGLARKAGVAFVNIEFDDEANTISDVNLNGQTVSLGALKDWFANHGLEVKGATTTKAINDVASSAYHSWQRASLGAIRVSDIDLLRIEPGTDAVIEILELKRSFKALNIWQPYRDDFQNFNVVENFAQRVGSRFRIVYNVRETRPVFRDDASSLSVFSYSRAEGARALGIISFDSFLAGGPQ